MIITRGFGLTTVEGTVIVADLAVLVEEFAYQLALDTASQILTVNITDYSINVDIPTYIIEVNNE